MHIHFSNPNLKLNLSDIDECTTQDFDCDPNAHCENTEGSYTCTCSPGYWGNGSACHGL